MANPETADETASFDTTDTEFVYEHMVGLTRCPKCGGTRWYSYDHNHSKPCEVCCPHSDGWWQLTEAHGHPGKFACKTGCGEIRDNADGSNNAPT